MTAKPKSSRPAKTGQKTNSAAPEQKNITVPCPDTDDPAEVASTLSKDIPDWDNLDKDERSELAQLIIAHRKRGAPARVKLIKKPGGGYSIDLDGKSDMLAALKLHQTFAANSLDPVNARASELIKYLDSVGACNDGRYNAALSFIESMEPKDQAEALLLVQMYVTHDAAIRALSMLGSAEWVPTVQTYGNLATKLLRVSQGQMETLARMRRGGEQVVKHIHVDNRGGQAVIAENVHNGGQGNGKNDTQPHEQSPCGPALLGHDPQAFGMPITGIEGKEEVPVARRTVAGRS